MKILSLLPPLRQKMESNIAKFGNHPGIATICYFDKNFTFFKEIEIVETKIIKEIKNLEIKKGSLPSDIPTKIVNEFGKLFTIFSTKRFNLYLNNREFTEIFEIAEVVPTYKKVNPFEEDSYRPITTWCISKV